MVWKQCLSYASLNIIMEKPCDQVPYQVQEIRSCFRHALSLFPPSALLKITLKTLSKTIENICSHAGLRSHYVEQPVPVR